MYNTKKYRAILFAPDGEYVTDFERDTKEEVWECVENMGSRWIFYPFVFVGTDKTIVDASEDMEWLKGRRIPTVAKIIRSDWGRRYLEAHC